MTVRRWTAVAVLAAFACSEPSSGPRTLLRDTGVQTSASVSRTSIEPGQETELTVTLANPTSEPVTLHFGSGCQVVAYVTDHAGTVIAPAGGGWVCVAVLTQLTLGPGETKTYTWGWAGGSDFASQLSQAGSEPPGNYYFYATMAAAEGTYDTPKFLVTLQ